MEKNVNRLDVYTRSRRWFDRLLAAWSKNPGKSKFQIKGVNLGCCLLSPTAGHWSSLLQESCYLQGLKASRIQQRALMKWDYLSPPKKALLQRCPKQPKNSYKLLTSKPKNQTPVGPVLSTPCFYELKPKATGPSKPAVATRGFRPGSSKAPRWWPTWVALLAQNAGYPKSHCFGDKRKCLFLKWSGTEWHKYEVFQAYGSMIEYVISWKKWDQKRMRREFLWFVRIMNLMVWYVLTLGTPFLQGFLMNGLRGFGLCKKNKVILPGSGDSSEAKRTLLLVAKCCSKFFGRSSN